MRRPRLPTSFRGRLLLIAGLALVVRVAYVAVTRTDIGFGDAFVYWVDAQHLADGQGFRHPFTGAPTAEHPPLHVLLLAGFDLLGVNGYQHQKLGLCVIGTGTVVLIALLARTYAGERAGLLAGGIAAVYPNLVMADGTLLSETLYLAFLVGALLAATRFADRPSGRGLAAVGVLVGLAALTRAEALALVPLLVLPLAWMYGAPWRGRLTLAACGVVAFALVLTPWTVRNLQQFEEPVLVSNNGNAVFVGANCERTFYGDLVGSWSFDCYGADPPGDESERAHAYRRRGTRYIREHLARFPVVLAARAARALELYHPNQGVFLQTAEGRAATPARAGIGMFWVLAPLAIGGMVLLGIRRRRTWILLAPIVMAAVTCLTAYGSTRLRIAAEPSIVVLAAVSVDVLIRRRRAHRPGPGAAQPA